ncbi:MAG: nitroreductase family protein [Gemmatimonadales bacterium]|jgi:nitroreductase
MMLLSPRLFDGRRETAVTTVGPLPEPAATVLEAIKQRRTVRRFRPTPVPPEHLTAILDAAHYAPTAGNQQPWRFLVVRDREKLELLKRRALHWYLERVREADSARGMDMDSIRAGAERALERALSAPVYVAVLVDREAPYERYLVQDGSLAVGNLMIAARALGYGTAFLTTLFPEGPMREFFEIPDRYSLICFTPIGVPETWPEMPPKRRLEELVVFETFAGGDIEGDHPGSSLFGRSLGVQAPEERDDRSFRP